MPGTRPGMTKENSHAPHDPQASADRRAEPDRRDHRHVSADARAARRSGGLFRGTRRDHGGDRAGPRQARPRQAADRPVRQLRGRSRARRSRDLAHHRPAGRDRHPQPPAGLRRADAARPDRLDADRGAARHPGRDQAGIARRSSLPRDRDRGRVTAGVLHRPDPGLCLLLPAGHRAGAARAARHLPERAAAGHRLLPDRQR